jgi:hypothetical protein
MVRILDEDDYRRRLDQAVEFSCHGNLFCNISASFRAWVVAFLRGAVIEFPP